MRLSDVSFDPDERTLRQFGLIALVGFPLLAWAFGGRPGWGELLASRPIQVGLAVGGACALVGLARPRWLRWFFVGFCLLALPIGLVVSELMIALMFFLLFTPIALAFKLAGRDALERRWRPELTSYWRPKATPTDPGRYFRQY